MPPRITRQALHDRAEEGLNRASALRYSSDLNGSRQTSYERDEESDVSEGQEDEEERSKLEVKREKNRVKQRNLRLRRAKYISTLEANNTALRGECSNLRADNSRLQEHLMKAESWNRELESMLVNKGFSKDVEALRVALGSSNGRRGIKRMQPPNGDVSSGRRTRTVELVDLAVERDSVFRGTARFLEEASANGNGHIRNLANPEPLFKTYHPNPPAAVEPTRDLDRSRQIPTRSKPIKSPLDTHRSIGTHSVNDWTPSPPSIKISDLLSGPPQDEQP